MDIKMEHFLGGIHLTVKLDKNHKLIIASKDGKHFIAHHWIHKPEQSTDDFNDNATMLEYHIACDKLILDKKIPYRTDFDDY